jgi:hypothetical protein
MEEKDYDIENDDSYENNDINEDKTFNKLRNIQILIRKESSLKGLCKYKYNINQLNINSHKNNKRNYRSNRY